MINLIDKSNYNYEKSYSIKELEYGKVYINTAYNWIVTKVSTSDGDKLLYLNKPDNGHYDIFDSGSYKFKLYSDKLTYVIG